MSERVACSLGAALRYGVPANVVLAVAEQEGGRPGQWVANSNGTFDVGALQFNTAYLRSLAGYGIVTHSGGQARMSPFPINAAIAAFASPPSAGCFSA